MEIEITKDEENKLLSRREVRFKVAHEGEPTPPKKDVEETLAAKLDADTKLMIIEHYTTRFGTNVSDGTCYVYGNETAMVRAEPTKFLRSEKRLELKKKEREKAKKEKKAKEKAKKKAKKEAEKKKKAKEEKKTEKPKKTKKKEEKKKKTEKKEKKAKKKAKKAKKKETGEDYGKELKSLSGIGPKTKDEIMKEFPTAAKLEKAIKEGKELPFASNVNEVLKKHFK